MKGLVGDGIEKWTGKGMTPKRSSFKVTPGRTQDELCHELSMIGVRACVIQADLREADIRVDGMPRANARFRTPRVIITFKHPRQGEISFPCGTYDRFWCNVRGVVKTLESLRAVDRYGVTQRAEQYTGWKALPTGSAIVLNEFSSVEDAARFMIETAGMWVHSNLVNRVVFHDSVTKEVFDQAAKRSHPDHDGGSDALMAKVNAARAMIRGCRGQHVGGA